MLPSGKCGVTMPRSPLSSACKIFWSSAKSVKFFLHIIVRLQLGDKLIIRLSCLCTLWSFGDEKSNNAREVCFIAYRRLLSIDVNVMPCFHYTAQRAAASCERMLSVSGGTPP